MGLRAATVITFLLGATSVVLADTRSATEPSKTVRPATADPAKAANPPSGDPPSSAAPPAANAEQPDPSADGDGENDEPVQGGEPTMPPHVVGPKRVELGNGAAIDLPAGFLLFERAEAQQISRQLGNSTESVVAIVGKSDGDWLIVIHYDDSGFIDDSDADDLDADGLLESLREGTAEQNKRRKEMGKPELFVDGWSEKPRYERSRHHLVWGIAAHTADDKVINFLTRILGRNGYLSVNLVAAPEKLDAAKRETLAILEATQFKPGVRFEDHVSSDRSSGVGLRGLVLGGAGVAVASKLGLLAKLLLGLKKGIALIVLVVGAAFRRLFRRGARSSDGSAVASGSLPSSPPAPPAAGEAQPPAADVAIAPAASPLPPDDPASGGSSPA